MTCGPRSFEPVPPDTRCRSRLAAATCDLRLASRPPERDDGGARPSAGGAPRGDDVGAPARARRIRVVAMLCFNFYFLPPIGTLTIADPQNWIALAAFFTTALTVGQLSAREKRRGGDARRLARLQAVVADLGQRALRGERHGG